MGVSVLFRTTGTAITLVHNQKQGCYLPLSPQDQKSCRRATLQGLAFSSCLATSHGQNQACSREGTVGQPVGKVSFQGRVAYISMTGDREIPGWGLSRLSYRPSGHCLGLSAAESRACSRLLSLSLNLKTGCPPAWGRSSGEHGREFSPTRGPSRPLGPAHPFCHPSVPAQN